MDNSVSLQRRRALGTAIVIIGLNEWGVVDSARAQSTLPSKPLSSGATFAAIRQIDAGLLSIGYAESGPADGPVAILLHGWPYDIHSYIEVAPLLASA